MRKYGADRIAMGTGAVALPLAVAAVGYYWLGRWGWSLVAGAVTLLAFLALWLILELPSRRASPRGPQPPAHGDVAAQLAALRADRERHLRPDASIDPRLADHGAALVRVLDADPAKRAALHAWASTPDDPQATAVLASALRAASGERPNQRLPIGAPTVAFVAVAALVVGGVALNTAAGRINDESERQRQAADRAIGGTLGGERVQTMCSYLPVDRPQSAVKDVGAPRAADVPDTGTRTATVTTNFGELTISLSQAEAPCTVNSFTHLSRRDFFDDTKCHRLTTKGIFVLQCGDPTGTGMGGPPYQFGTENTPVGKRPAFRPGDVAMARAQDPNSNGSQFFIVYDDSPNLPPEYTLFGHVTKGLDVITGKIVPNGLAEDAGNKEWTAGSGDGRPAQDVVISDIRVR